MLDSSLIQLVGGVLYTDDLVTTLAKAVYAFGEDETFSVVLSMLGVDLSKEAIVSSLKKDYPAVAKSINKAESLAKLDASKWQWNVKDKASFAKALAAVLRPFAPALNVLLNSGELNIADVVDFKGSNGYENAVKPLLDALGCSTVSAAQYASDAKKNADNLLLNIINPLLDLVDEILADPVNMIAEILPQAANFIDKGGVQYAVESLLYPVTNLVSPLVSVITDETVFDFILGLLGLDINWKNLHNDIVLMLNRDVLNGIEIGGKKLAITLPAINWGTLAGCGKLSKSSIKADANKELMVLLRYIFKALYANKNAVMSLTGNNATVNQIIKNVLNCGPDKATQIIVKILLTNILNPLLDRVETILNSPVSALTETLPNLAYFVANDGIYNAVSNLIKPVTNILDEIAPIYKLDLDLSMLKNLDLANLVNSLLSTIDINGKKLGLVLSNIDLMALAGRGSLEEYVSVRTYNGSRMTAKRIVADKPAVMISVLRYIVSNLKTNLTAINGLLSGLDISEDVLEIINTVLEALATEDVDAVIELLVDLLFDIKSGLVDITPDTEYDGKGFVPFIPGNFYWAYWVILAAVSVGLGIGLYFILRKKKAKETENTEVR